MSRALLSLSVGLFLIVVSPALIRAAEDKKTDLETKVPEGKEIALTPVDVKAAAQPNEQGFFNAKVTPRKEGAKVKMPAQTYGLGFYAEPVKDGLKVVEVPENSGLNTMRTAAGKVDDGGPVRADPGDVITHVNGYAVKSVEDLLCALSTASDKKDVQIVMKDTNSGDLIVLYVTATKK